MESGSARLLGYQSVLYVQVVAADEPCTPSLGGSFRARCRRELLGSAHAHDTVTMVGGDLAGRAKKSVHTVEKQLETAYGKLRITGRGQLGALYADAGPPQPSQVRGAAPDGAASSRSVKARRERSRLKASRP